MSTLTYKQQAFIDEYLLDLNATQAAIRAGYSALTARQAGARLLTNVVISEAIKGAMGERAERVGLSTDEILGEAWKMAMISIGEDNSTKVNAIKLCMQHLGMLKPNNNHTQKRVIKVVTNIPGAPGSSIKI